MKLRKIITALLSLVILLSSVPAFDLTASAASMPYRITVDLTNQIVTIYSTADDTIVRQMLCSTGLKGSTPRGTYYLPKKLKSDERSEWFYFSSFSCYAHYATRVYMGIMFHSIPYATRRESSISKTALAEFGQPASHGCIRLRTEDAKFIALNCLVGTQCKIYRSNKPDEDLRALLMDSSYSADSGLSYKQFLGVPDEPGVLGRYSKGTEVEDLQYRLRALGFYTGEITGEYSGATVTSVKELQEVLGQEQNGAATKELQELVFSSDAPTAMNVTLTQGISGPAVRNLQQNLQALRLYNDEIDGVYDIDVADAVKRFQQAYGTIADGVANTTVQKAIDYEAYVRQKREEFMRRQQQYYNQYGNPYGNPYGNQYNRPPYNGGYGNPYNGAPNQNPTPNNASKDEDPFAEFSSSGDNNSTGGNASGNDGNTAAPNGENDPDSFFN